MPKERLDKTQKKSLNEKTAEFSPKKLRSGSKNKEVNDKKNSNEKSGNSKKEKEKEKEEKKRNQNQQKTDEEGVEKDAAIQIAQEKILQRRATKKTKVKKPPVPTEDPLLTEDKVDNRKEALTKGKTLKVVETPDVVVPNVVVQNPIPTEYEVLKEHFGSYSRYDVLTKFYHTLCDSGGDIKQWKKTLNADDKLTVSRYIDKIKKRQKSKDKKK